MELTKTDSGPTIDQRLQLQRLSQRGLYIHIAWFGCWIGLGVEKYLMAC